MIAGLIVNILSKKIFEAIEKADDKRIARKIADEFDAGNIQKGDNIFLMNTMSWNDKDLAHYVRSH